MRIFYPDFIVKALLQILPYLGVTIGIVAGTVFGGGLLGLLIARAKIRRKRISKALADSYTYIVRCIPSIVMLFLVYYGLPELILAATGYNCNGFPKIFFVLFTFIILFAANMSEVMRSAYEAIDSGQMEAALSTGLSGFQSFRRIVLPQSIAVALPNFSNALITLMKEGALAYTIGMVDIMGKGKLIIGINYGAYALETYIALGILYWLLTILVEKSFGTLERKLLKGKRILQG